MWRIAYLCAGASLALQLAACQTPAAVGDSHRLSFLQDGSTTREEVYLHLDAPSATFEAGSVLIYLLDEDAGGYILIQRNAAGWTGKFSLVLAFDEGGVLRRHSLIRVRTTPNER